VFGVAVSSLPLLFSGCGSGFSAAFILRLRFLAARPRRAFFSASVFAQTVSSGYWLPANSGKALSLITSF